MIGTVRGPATPDDRWPVVSLDDDPAAAIRAVAPDGVDRIVEVAFSDNVDLDVVVARAGAVVAAYNSPDATPAVPYWPLSIKNMILRFVGSNTFAPDVVRQAAGQLTGLAASGALRVPVGRVFDLDEVAAAQDLVESGAASGRVLVRIP